LLPPLLHSTLFPYTTLFRSARELRAAGQHGANRPGPLVGPCVDGDPVPDGRQVGRSLRFVGQPPRNVAAELACLGENVPGATVLDRKSTRLNSSHEWISYAV